MGPPELCRIHNFRKRKDLKIVSSFKKRQKNSYNILLIYSEQKVAILCNGNEKIYKFPFSLYYHVIRSRNKGNTCKTKRNHS